MTLLFVAEDEQVSQDVGGDDVEMDDVQPQDEDQQEEEHQPAQSDDSSEDEDDDEVPLPGSASNDADEEEEEQEAYKPDIPSGFSEVHLHVLILHPQVEPYVLPLLFLLFHQLQ